MDFIDHRSTAKFIFKTSATDEKARIDDSGNILTGKTSSNFSTAGAEVRNVGQVWATRDGGVPLALNRLSSDGNIAQFYQTGTLVGAIGTKNNTLTIGSGDTGVLFNESISAIYPWDLTANGGSNGLIDLGIATRQWKDLHIGGNANIGGNAVITGNLTVNGTTTTINTATLDVEDKNITLNYGTGDTSSTADGAGITIQDAVDASNNATILWDATNDEWDFSHPINVTGNVTSSSTVIAGTVPRMYTSSDRGYFVAGTNDASNQHLYLGSYHGSTLKELTFSGSNNAFYPQTSGAIDLGLSSKKFKNLQLSGTITFAGGTTSANLNFGDNDKAIFGAGSDLEIFSSGSTALIKAGNATSDIRIESDNRLVIADRGFNEAFAVFNDDGDVKLYNDGTQRLATTSTGINVTGTVTTDAVATGTSTFTGNLTIDAAGASVTVKDSNDAGTVAFVFENDSGTTSSIRGASSSQDIQIKPNEVLAANFASGGDISFYEDTGTTAKLTWDASAETLNFADNGKAVFGAGSDLQIYHDGSNSYIDDAGSGRLNIRASDLRIEKYTGETIAKFLADGAVELNYNDVKKLATTATGVDVTGTVTADGFQTDTANTSFNLLARNSTNTAVYAQNGGTGPVFEARSGSMSAGQGDVHLKVDNNGDISFYEDTGTTAKLFWDASTEFLGLGSTAPQAKLDIVDTASDVQMRVYKNDGVKNTRITVTADDSGAKIHYRDADNAGALRFNNNLGEVMRITANTTRVGIGTSAPLKALHVKSGSEVVRIEADASTAVYQTFFRAGTRVGYQGFGSTGDIYYLSNDTANGSNYYMVNGTGSHRFYNDTSELVRIDSSGRVGIGTSSPNFKLDVAGNARASYFALRSNESAPSESAFIYRPATGVLGFGTNNTERLRIDSSGNVGIGRASSSVVRLSVAGADASSTKYAFEATNNSNNTRFIVRNDGQSQFFKSDNAASMTVTSAGNVGIGVTSPENRLHIRGVANNTYIRIDDGTDFSNIGVDATGSFYNTNTNHRFLTASGSTEAMRIDSSGNLLVGKTAIGSTTDGFEARASGYTALSDTSGAALNVNRNSTDGNIITLTKDGTTVGSIGSDSGVTIYMDGGGARAGIYMSGSGVLPRYNGALANNATDLGASNRRFKDLYLSSQINVSGGTSFAGYFSTAYDYVAKFESTDGSAFIVLEDSNSTTNGNRIGAVGDTLQFENAGSEAMRLDASGNLLVGKTSASVGTDGAQFLTGGYSGVSATSTTAFFANRNTTDGDVVEIGKNGVKVGSIGVTAGSIAFGQANTALGAFNTDRLLFPATSAGAVQDNAIDLGYASGRFKDLYLSGGLRGDTLTFKNLAGSERTRIDSSGNQLWGKTSADNTTQGIRFLGSSGFMSVVRSSNTLAVFNRIDTDGTLINFRTNGTTRGSISISGSTTSYNTTSDERAKDNIQDAPSASDDIDAIKVRSFDWKADGTHQKYGMIAQELSTVAPDAVTVPEDAEEMQSVDYSKLVPMLVREIQSLRARVAQLEGDN